jgi:hemoglobin
LRIDLKDAFAMHQPLAILPHSNAPGLAVGIDEAMVETVVRRFYARIRAHAEMGPIFEAHIDDWPRHIAHLVDFWSSVTLLTGRFKGTPLQRHLALPDLKPAHFRIWLALFAETLAECCDPPQAALFQARAERIATSFQLAMLQKAGELPPRAARTLLPPANQGGELQ